jgi:hypothetical protein
MRRVRNVKPMKQQIIPLPIYRLSEFQIYGQYPFSHASYLRWTKGEGVGRKEDRPFSLQSAVVQSFLWRRLLVLVLRAYTHIGSVNICKMNARNFMVKLSVLSHKPGGGNKTKWELRTMSDGEIMTARMKNALQRRS